VLWGDRASVTQAGGATPFLAKPSQWQSFKDQQPDLKSLAEKNHIIFQSIPEGSSLWFSGAYDFEALSCQCGLQFQALNTDLSSGEFGGVAYFPFFNEAKGCCVF